MFHILDSKKVGALCFSDFVGYLNLLLNGEQKDKSRLIFDLLTQKRKHFFTIEDLQEFYCLVKSEQVCGRLGEEAFREEQEMAELVFSLMETNTDEPVDFEKFNAFLLNDREYQNLFNIFSDDAGNFRMRIKARNSLSVVLEKVRKSQRDLEELKTSFVN